MSEALDVARRLVGAGISVLPVGEDEMPVLLPAVGDEDDAGGGRRAWAFLRERLPTDDELVAWFAGGEATPARIHGGVSGDCETIEIDGGYVFRGWLTRVRAVFPDLPDRLTTISTPAGGCDVFYRCSGPVEGNQKLAEVIRGDGQPKTLIKTRGRGDYSVCPGGPIRFPPYRWTGGPPVWQPVTISADEREALLSAARQFRQCEPVTACVEGAAKPGAKAGSIAMSSGPGRQSGHHQLHQLHHANTGDKGDDAAWPEPQGESFLPWCEVENGLEVEPKEIAWLWPGRIPFGKLTILAGSPGVGKTFVSCHLAARVTTGGGWPDGSGQAPGGEVAFLNSEDAFDDVLLPRLVAQGADRSQVHSIRAMPDRDRTGRHIERAVRFDIDIERMRRCLDAHRRVRLLVVDPISAYLGEADSRRVADARDVCGPLSRLAEDFGVAVVGISQLSNGGRGTAITRGNTAFLAPAPVVWVHVPDQDDPDRVLWLPVKMKLARRPNGLAYRIVEGRVEWEPGAVEVTADEAMNRTATGPKRDRVAEATAWLRQQLAGGEWVKSAEIETQLDEAGISYATYLRAKKQLGVESSKGFGQGLWYVRLLEESPNARGGADGTVDLVE